MDIDIIEENVPQFESIKLAGKRPLAVDEAHPFELEIISSGYSGRSAVERYIQVISQCPSLALPAFQAALELVLQMSDTTLYRAVVTSYEQTAIASNGELPPLADVHQLNQHWLDDMKQKNQAQRVKLETELKTYTSNMIKESIRMAYRDLGDFYRATGDHATALKHYTKSREFCTTSQHVLEMCLSVLELLIEHRNYAHMSTYVFKADAALDATSIARGPAAAPTAPASAATGKDKAAAEREKVQSKLDVSIALSYLGQGNFEKAAQAFLKVGSVKSLGDWAGRLIAPSDVAIYTTLCALSTFSRQQIRKQILNNDNFGVYIEQEPYVRELLESYMGNRFKLMLEILERYSTRHALDLHLAYHIAALTNQIRSRALVQYFQPFASIKLERMSTAFGWTVEELERQVVTLIQSGEIQARVDRQNKILKAKETDQRSALFARAIKSGETMQVANRKLLLRMRLQQADLIVKAPRSQITGHTSEYLLSDYYMS
ncbi:PCI-domain-containing protein [Daedalea quercina L-15889]|uniref:PCI-domain-containing protein n=1 Tax=Daedalea quercina L-15889 TaxID=1314783 RepID=A0A165LIC5_9APHY|nr:PCI-domain-containing protein [Daedalea quercina L-15889]